MMLVRVLLLSLLVLPLCSVMAEDLDSVLMEKGFVASEITLACVVGSEVISTFAFSNGKKFTLPDGTQVEQRGSAEWGKKGDGTDNHKQVLAEVMVAGSSTPRSVQFVCKNGQLTMDQYPKN